MQLQTNPPLYPLYQRYLQARGELLQALRSAQSPLSDVVLYRLHNAGGMIRSMVEQLAAVCSAQSINCAALFDAMQKDAREVEIEIKERLSRLDVNWATRLADIPKGVQPTPQGGIYSQYRRKMRKKVAIYLSPLQLLSRYFFCLLRNKDEVF
jgi:hypothetical protein